MDIAQEQEIVDGYQGFLRFAGSVCKDPYNNAADVLQSALCDLFECKTARHPRGLLTKLIRTRAAMTFHTDPMKKKNIPGLRLLNGVDVAQLPEYSRKGVDLRDKLRMESQWEAVSGCIQKLPSQYRAALEQWSHGIYNSKDRSQVNCLSRAFVRIRKKLGVLGYPIQGYCPYCGEESKSRRNKANHINVCKRCKKGFRLSPTNNPASRLPMISKTPRTG